MQTMNYQQMWMELRTKARGALLEEMNRMEREEYDRVNPISRTRKELNTDLWDAVKKGTR